MNNWLCVYEGGSLKIHHGERKQNFKRSPKGKAFMALPRRLQLPIPLPSNNNREQAEPVRGKESWSRWMRINYKQIKCEMKWMCMVGTWTCTRGHLQGQDKGVAQVHLISTNGSIHFLSFIRTLSRLSFTCKWEKWVSVHCCHTMLNELSIMQPKNDIHF